MNSIVSLGVASPPSSPEISDPPTEACKHSEECHVVSTVAPHSGKRQHEPPRKPRFSEETILDVYGLSRGQLRGGARNSFVERLVNPVSSIAAAPVQAPIEYFQVKRVKGDGRCLFRALAQGVSRHKSIYLTPVKEEQEADNLRMAVREALCASKDMQREFRDVIQTLESPLPKYCRQLRSPGFWGGEPELLVLSKLLKTPIHVYKNESEFGSAGIGFVKIVEYGRDAKKIRHPPVKLLYSDCKSWPDYFMMGSLGNNEVKLSQS